MHDTVDVEVSQEEAAVVGMMRSSDRAGLAIFKYAMQYDNDIDTDDMGLPWRRDPR